jgi:hypothetical protein
MKKTIIITEEQSKKLINYMINEQTQLDIVLSLKKFLDQYYEKGEQTEISPDGKFTSKKVIGVKSKGDDGKDVVVTNISPQDLFYRLEPKVKDKIDKGEKRDKFLKQIIIDWFNNDISDCGNLSKNLSI